MTLDPGGMGIGEREEGPRKEPPGKAVVFIGFMGAGKSYMAAELSAELGVRRIDSDRLLEKRFGHTVAREFELHGEASFRAAEEQVVCELLARAGPGDVIALGGGAVMSERVAAALAPHLTVLLEVAPEAAWERANLWAGAHPREERPLLKDRAHFLELFKQRRGRYEQLADAILPAIDPLVIGNDNLDMPVVAVRALPALRNLAAAPVGTRMAWAHAHSGEHPVLVGRGLLDSERLPEIWPLRPEDSRPYCVTDTAVGGLYRERLAVLHRAVAARAVAEAAAGGAGPHPPGNPAGPYTAAGAGPGLAIEPGETSKTLAWAERVWQDMLRAGTTRADHVVALGGGVVGDLAGFCAAAFQRGVPIVQVPTTLVAQVDSAYGGKTGVDLPGAKNYVGAYHHPAGVLADPDLLASLPGSERAAGWVEVLKTALIAGGELWERVALAEGCEVDARTIFDCARVKLAIVAVDERDVGLRQALNLGHTVGHAIETATGYARYRHGEAVGLGLLAMLTLSGVPALRAQVRDMLRARGLPVAIERGAAHVDAIVAATARDKKRLGIGAVPFVLLPAPGEPRIGCEVSEDEVRDAVAELIA